MGKITGAFDRERVVYKVNGMVRDDAYGYHSNCMSNMLTGVIERILLVKKDGLFSRPFRPRRGLFVGRLREFRKRLLRRIGRNFAPLDPLQFVALYSGRKRTIYEKARLSLLKLPLTIKDTVLSTFIKAEKVNFWLKPDAVCRLIQPRSPRYNLELGCYLRRIEHAVYHAVDGVFGEVTVAKGLNVRQRGEVMLRKWRKFRKPVAVPVDASKFDQRISDIALEWEHSVYNWVYRYAPWLRRLLSWQLKNKGTARIGGDFIRYETLGCRMSGDMNTSLGNVLIMCAMIWSYFRERVKYELFNDGDDCVIIMETGDLPVMEGFSKWFGEMGFDMKVEQPVFKLEHIEFCQCRPVLVANDDCVMVRNPFSALSKDLITLKPLDDPIFMKRWLATVGQGGLALCSGIPVMQEYYQRCIHLADGAKAIEDDPNMVGGLFYLGRGLVGNYAQVTDCARVSFAEAFNIPPSHQVVNEEEISRICLGVIGVQIAPIHPMKLTF